MSNTYNVSRLRRALLHFVSGRAVQALARAGLVLLVVRLLDVEDFGAYMLFVGLSEAVLQMCSFGLLRVGQRFLPEIAETASRRNTYHFVASIALLQFAIIASAVGLLWMFWDSLLLFAGFTANQAEQSRPAILLFLVVPTFRFVADLLESLLEQGRAQTCRALMPIGRLLGLTVILFAGVEITLHRILLLDGLVTLFCLLLATMLLTASIRRLPERDLTRPLPLKDMARLAWHMSVADLLESIYSPGTMRLVLANTLGVAESGLFAFLQSLQKIVGRYLPGVLLLGLVRPMLISRISSANGVRLVERATGLMIKVNWLVIAGATMVALFAGDYVVELASGGQFTNAGTTLFLMIFILAITSQRRVLEMLLQIVNQTDILRSTALFAPATLGAAWLVSSYGLNAAILATACVLGLGNMICICLLRTRTSQFPADWRGAGGIVISALAGAVAGYLVQTYAGSWIAIAAAGLLLLALLAVFKPFHMEELRLADRGIGRLAGRMLGPFARSVGSVT